VRDVVDHQDFLKAYEKELENFAAKITPRKITTIFFGGGTPSLMPLFLVEGILKKISQLWQIDENCEISLEANPTSFESAKFKDLRALGINRLSLGIQALNDADLKFLGREHSSAEAIATIENAAKIFDNFSFDLIYARPKQELKHWEEELKRAISFGTKHLSLYQLTIEKGTRFFSDFQNKKFVMPNEDLASEFYEMTGQITLDAGFETYEISNYAKNGPRNKCGVTTEGCSTNSAVTPRLLRGPENYQCQHNLTYWRGDDYIGVGAGAHSRIYFENENERSAISMLCEPSSWLKKVLESGFGIQKIEKISREELLEELILMGLRLEEGITEENFYQHFGRKFAEIFDYQNLQKLSDQKLILLEGGKIKIAPQKRILSDAIITKISQALQ